MEQQLTSTVAVAALIISFLSFGVSILSLVIAIVSFKRKEGIEIRASFSVVSTIQSKYQHVGEVTLENMKDRPVAIFGIYLRLGYNNYIELEKHETDPITLEAFRTYSRQYDPVDFYSANLLRIDVGSLITNHKSKIVILTSRGRHVAKKYIDKWDRDIHGFRNYSSTVIRPIRVTLGDRGYGSNAKFGVVLKHEDSEDEVFALYPHDYQFQTFHRFALTKDALTSKERLTTFFNQKLSENLLHCQSFEIYDFDEKRKEMRDHYSPYESQILHLNWFQYFVTSRIHSIIQTHKSKLKIRPFNRN